MYGADGEFLLRRNRQAFDWVSLISKPAAANASIDTGLQLFGMPMNFPLMLAPTAFQVQLHPDAEAASHKAATPRGAPSIQR